MLILIHSSENQTSHISRWDTVLTLTLTAANSTTHNNSNAVGLTVTQLPSIPHALLKCVSVRHNECVAQCKQRYAMSCINSYCQKFVSVNLTCQSTTQHCRCDFWTDLRRLLVNCSANRCLQCIQFLTLHWHHTWVSTVSYVIIA